MVKRPPFFKDPATDPSKRSKAGRLDLISDQGRYRTVVLENQRQHHQSSLETVYENGKLLRTVNLEEVRANMLKG